MSTMPSVSAKNAKNWELIENKELNGDFGVISGDSKKEPSELRTSAENTGLKTYKNQSVQVGCFTWTRTKIDGVRIRCPTIRR